MLQKERRNKEFIDDGTHVLAHAAGDYNQLVVYFIGDVMSPSLPIPARWGNTFAAFSPNVRHSRGFASNVRMKIRTVIVLQSFLYGVPFACGSNE